MAIDFEDGVLGAYCTFTCNPSLRSHHQETLRSFCMLASRTVIFDCHRFFLRVNVRFALFFCERWDPEVDLYCSIVVIGIDNLTLLLYHVFPISVKRQKHTQTSDD